MRRYRDGLVTAAGRWLGPVFAARPGWAPPPPRRVLVLKPCCVGDLIFASAALRELRRGLPASRIEVAVGGWSRAAVEHNPHVDEIVDLEAAGDGPRGLAGLLRSARLKEGAPLARLVRMLRERRYDWCLVLDRSPLLGLVPALAGIPLRAGLDSLHRGFAHNVRVPARGVRHESDLYLDVVRAVGIEPRDGATELFPSSEDAAWARQTLARLQAQGHLRRPLVLLHPGGGQNPSMTFSAKQWPAERYGVLARLCRDRLGGTVVLVGGPRDTAIARRVRETAGDADRLVDLTGLPTLGQLAALAALAEAWVGNDTGPSHMAVAVGTPSVLVFGPSDPRRYGPRRPNGVVVWAAADMARHLRLDPRRHHPLGAVDHPPAAAVEAVWCALQRALALGRQAPAPGEAVWPVARPG